MQEQKGLPPTAPPRQSQGYNVRVRGFGVRIECRVALGSLTVQSFVGRGSIFYNKGFSWESGLG